MVVRPEAVGAYRFSTSLLTLHLKLNEVVEEEEEEEEEAAAAGEEEVGSHPYAPEQYSQGFF